MLINVCDNIYSTHNYQIKQKGKQKVNEILRIRELLHGEPESHKIKFLLFEI